MAVVRKADFNDAVLLPPGLTITAMRKAIEYDGHEHANLAELYFVQANIFSALVRIHATKALDANSVYEKQRRVGLAQQRFPHLKTRESGPEPSPRQSPQDGRSLVKEPLDESDHRTGRN